MTDTSRSRIELSLNQLVLILTAVVSFAGLVSSATIWMTMPYRMDRAEDGIKMNSSDIRELRRVDADLKQVVTRIDANMEYIRENIDELKKGARN